MSTWMKRQRRGNAQVSGSAFSLTVSFGFLSKKTRVPPPFALLVTLVSASLYPAEGTTSSGPFLYVPGLVSASVSPDPNVRLCGLNLSSAVG